MNVIIRRTILIAPVLTCLWPPSVSRADLNATDDVHGEMFGKTALIFAAEGGYWDRVKVLVAAGSEVNVTDGVGDTALSSARQNRFGNVVNELTAAGAKQPASTTN